MNESRTYVIRRAFVVPLGLLIGLTLVLLVVCIVQGQPVAKSILLAVMVLPLVAFFVESAFRRLVVDATGVTAFRPFRQRQILFAKVTSLETVRVRSRVFMTLAAGDDDFLIFSNSYSKFPQLIAQLVKVLPVDAITEETQQLAKKPPMRQADIVTTWFAVAALVYVLMAQF